MSVTDRREAVKELTDEGHSNREIAEIIGVSDQTINNDAKNLAPEGPKSKETPTDPANNLAPLDAVAALAA
jgi:transposase